MGLATTALGLYVTSLTTAGPALAGSSRTLHSSLPFLPRGTPGPNGP